MENFSTKAIAAASQARSTGDGRIASGTAAGYSEPAKPPVELPVNRAIEELKKEVAMIRESAGMLISRLAPVSYPVDIKGRDDGPKEGCFVELELRNISASLSEVTSAMNMAREALCI